MQVYGRHYTKSYVAYNFGIDLKITATELLVFLIVSNTFLGSCTYHSTSSKQQTLGQINGDQNFKAALKSKVNHSKKLEVKSR